MRTRAASSSVAVAPRVAGLAMRTTSYPVHGAFALLAASRNTRLERFRTTAFPSRLPAIKATRPSGPRPSGVFAMSAVTKGCEIRWLSRKIRSISRDDLIVLTRRPFTQGWNELGRKHLAAFAASSSKNCSASARGHASTEAVRLRTLPDVWLVSPLHVFLLSCPSVLGQSPTIICGLFYMSQRPIHCAVLGHPQMRAHARANDSQERDESVDSVEKAGFTRPGSVDNLLCCVVTVRSYC